MFGVQHENVVTKPLFLINQINRMKNFVCFKWPVCLCMLLLSHLLNAADTTYINLLGTRVSKTEASLYRVSTHTESGFMEFKDYDLNGQLRVVGYFTSEAAAIRTGEYLFFDSLGFQTACGSYTKGFKSGIWTYYHDHSTQVFRTEIYSYPSKEFYRTQFDSLTQQPMYEAWYDADTLRNGPLKTYFEQTKQCKYQSNYQHGRLDGEQHEYYENGLIKRIELYQEGFRKKGTLFDPQGHEIPYYPAFVYPRPPVPLPGYLYNRVPCLAELLKHQSIQYQIEIDNNGQVLQVEILNVSDSTCCQSIVSAIHRMKKWQPARFENKTVRYTLKSWIRLGGGFE